MPARTVASVSQPISAEIQPIRAPYPSARTLFHFAQIAMVLGYVGLIFHPLDGDSMLLGLLCEAAALWLYVMSRSASDAPSSS